MRTKDLKARAEEFLAEYDEEMVEDLIQVIRDSLQGLTVEDISEDNIFDDIQEWKSKLPEAYNWAYDKVQSELDDIGDAKYQQMKDER